MEKKHYVTTAIPYVNGKPHIGNAIDYLLADIWARYYRQGGAEVRLQAGTDEHGNKVAAKAASEGLTPQEYADKNCKNFEALIQRMKVGYTDFVRTTDIKHQAAVQYVWQKLAPHIYKGNYEGWYCEGCEGFVTDKEAQKNEGKCIDHGTAYVRLKEENYYLKISDFKVQIQEAIATDRLKIVPEFRKKEFLALLPEMPDVSISRPKKTLSWGVPVPGDDTQVMYVWLDALANYITVLGYPNEPTWEAYWPADVQVIGKDILKFHAGIWPAMLLGLGLELPKTLLVHGHVNVAGTKMSKTVGNVVDPMECIDNYGLDAFRYYFSRHISTTEDGDFTWEKFENAYNNELGNDLGNLVQRVAGMVDRYLSGVTGVEGNPEPDHDVHAFREAMKNMDFSAAIDQAWVLVHGANRFIEETKPWVIAKAAAGGDENEKAHLEEVLQHSVSTILQIAKMLEPFLPETVEKIQAIFGSGIVKMEEGGLFPKIYLHTSASGKKTEGQASSETATAN